MSALPHPAGPYVSPKRGVAAEDCTFYHTIDLPGHGAIQGEWDLRGGMDDYVGRLDYRGKRVLEFGTASGAVCFALEQRGAEVVAFDIAADAQWDVVPLASHPDLSGLRQQRQAHLERLRNSFWFGHALTGSSARVVHGHIYQVPATIGPVDVALFGSILLHLRDPFLALANGARLARETIVVTEPLRELLLPALPARSPWLARARRKASLWLLRALRFGGLLAPDLPLMALLPDPRNPDNTDTWWGLSPTLIQRALAVLGFERSQTYAHRQLYRGRKETLFTVVAHRARPMPP